MNYDIGLCGKLFQVLGLLRAGEKPYLFVFRFFFVCFYFVKLLLGYGCILILSKEIIRLVDRMVTFIIMKLVNYNNIPYSIIYDINGTYLSLLCSNILCKILNIIYRLRRSYYILLFNSTLFSVVTDFYIIYTLLNIFKIQFIRKDIT